MNLYLFPRTHFINYFVYRHIYLQSIIPGEGCKDVRESLRNLLLFQRGSLDSVNKIMTTLEYLGLLSDNVPFPKGMSNLDALCMVLQKKLTYGPDERDLVLLQHKLDVTRMDGRREVVKSTLLAYGAAGGDTAMSRTVGLPVGIAASLMLQGKLKGLKKGVSIPTSDIVYKPTLKLLAAEGIHCKEESLPL